MKKIGIVSCYFQKNYGSMLQAYATQQVIKKLGYIPETICIDGIAKEIRNAKLKYYFRQLNDWNVVKGKLGFIKRVFFKKLDKDFKKNVLIRDKKFNEFKNLLAKLHCLLGKDETPKLVAYAILFTFSGTKFRV